MIDSAYGLRTGKEFCASDILSPERCAQMKVEGLIDKEGNEVIPVRNKNCPHFRRKDAQYGLIIGRGEKDPMHDGYVSRFCDVLNDQQFELLFFVANKFQRTYKNDGVIYKNNNDYKWICEKAIATINKKGSMIRPDILGEDASSPENRKIIIEVIRTHPPEPETMKELIELSKNNYCVFFHFLGNEDEPSNHYNKHSCSGISLTLNFSLYIIDGNVFENCEMIKGPAEGESFGEWYFKLKFKHIEKMMKSI